MVLDAIRRDRTDGALVRIITPQESASVTAARCRAVAFAEEPCTLIWENSCRIDHSTHLGGNHNTLSRIRRSRSLSHHDRCPSHIYGDDRMLVHALSKQVKAT